VKLTLDLSPGEVVDITELLSEMQEVLAETVQALELAEVRPTYQELMDKKRTLNAINKVLGQVALGGVRADDRRPPDETET
jgi:hypothetical protein